MVDNDAPNRLLPPMAWNAWGDPDAAKPLSDGIRGLLEQALGVTPAAIPAPGIDEVQLRPSALTDIHRDGLTDIVGADYLHTGTTSACCTPAASRLRICCGASKLTRTRRTPCCCPPTRTRSRPCWPTVRTTASRWCPSAAAPAWSAGWTRSAASSLPSSRWTCVVSTNCTPWTRSLRRPNSAPVSPDPTPSDCWASAASRWAIFRRASCSPPSAVSRLPAPRARTPPATGGSTT